MLEPLIRIASDAITVGEKTSALSSTKRTADNDISFSRPLKKTALTLPCPIIRASEILPRCLPAEPDVPQWVLNGFDRFAKDYAREVRPDIIQILIKAFQARDKIPGFKAARVLQMVFECISLRLFETIQEERAYRLADPGDADIVNLYAYLSRIRQSERNTHRWFVDVQIHQMHLHRYFTGLVTKKKDELAKIRKDRKRARKQNEKFAPGVQGPKAADIVKSWAFPDKNVDADLAKGQVLDILDRSMPGALIPLLPSTDVYPRLKFESPHYLLALPIQPTE